MVVYRPYLGWYQELVVSDKFYEAIHQGIMARAGRPPVYKCGGGVTHYRPLEYFLLADRHSFQGAKDTGQGQTQTYLLFLPLEGAASVEICEIASTILQAVPGGI
jgi:hypothetical protein